MSPVPRVLEDPEEVLGDVLSLCAKVCHESETSGRVRMDDLCALRDAINDIRSHVAGGGGYKSLPRIVRLGEEP